LPGGALLDHMGGTSAQKAWAVARALEEKKLVFLGVNLGLKN
jgi:acyl CoA:acetate/3-ketoacid CoA transferase beta subunit